MNNLNRLDNSTSTATIWDDNQQLNSIKEIYGKSLSTGEFKTFVEIGRATGLNPFLRELWAVKYGSAPASIFVGRDGYRRSAQANKDYDYHVVDAVYSNDDFKMVNGEVAHRYSIKDRGNLIGAYCLVKRKSSTRHIYAYVDVKEYSTGKNLWQSKPATMLKKVAEAQGLRMAFQELFAGTYDENENWHDAKNDSQPARGISGLKERLGLQPIQQMETANDITGEVIEDVENHNEDFVRENTNDDIAEFKFSVDDVKAKIESANTISDLLEAVDLARCLPESDRATIRGLYKDKEKQINNNISV